jgi:hypothetical protein
VRFYKHLSTASLLLLLLSSCKDIDKQSIEGNVFSPYYEVSIQDPSIIDLVRRYISANRIPAKKCVVFLSLRTDNEGITLRLSHTYNDVSRGLKQPMGYAMVDSCLVLLYASHYPFLLPRKLENEISKAIKERGIRLQDIQLSEDHLAS